MYIFSVLGTTVADGLIVPSNDEFDTQDAWHDSELADNAESVQAMELIPYRYERM